MLSGACAGGPIYFIVTCHSHSLFNNDLSEFSQLLASLVLGRYLEGKVVLYSGLRVGERAGTYDPCLYFSARKDVRGSHGWPVALFKPAGWVFATEGRLRASFVWCASSDYARAVLPYLLDSPEHSFSVHHS